MSSWRFDPPYPSFALVMAKAQQQSFDPSRLPSYRSSFLERHQSHPYAAALAAHPRYARRDPLMVTVDHRYQVQSIAEVEECVPQTRPPSGRQETPDNNVSPDELDDDGRVEEVPVQERLGRSKLASMWSTFVDTLSNKYLTKEALRDFLVVKWSAERPQKK
ncbi:hypothetical protein C8Q74DRAFT_72686 [Fomes fomentarius]|nr:hypothetical protein C8Q74DRAFT_72686 [Fomes fomentarius]